MEAPRSEIALDTELEALLGEYKERQRLSPERYRAIAITKLEEVLLRLQDGARFD